VIKALIFDFAGVIGTDGYWLWLEENVRDIDQHRQALHDISVRADRAEISAAEFTAAAARKAGVTPAVFMQGLLARTEINHDLVRLIEQLKPRYKIGLLSNFIFDWLNAILKANDLYRLFDTAIISSQVKMVKPDRAIYELACSRLGVTAAEAIFVDDRQGHVDAATRCGLNSFLYTDLPTLAAQLKSLGVTLGAPNSISARSKR
jgi:HAD superfamily hydrolase (TIGR01549 family)